MYGGAHAHHHRGAKQRSDNRQKTTSGRIPSSQSAPRVLWTYAHLINAYTLLVKPCRGQPATQRAHASSLLRCLRGAYTHLFSCGDWLAGSDSAANWLGLLAAEGAEAGGPQEP